ncbi:hypothetical protein V2J09_010776 [Rumex salicifolius]
MNGARMEMVSRYGGCSKGHSKLNFEDIIRRDQLRVGSWVSKFTGTSVSTEPGPAVTTSTISTTNLPSHSSYSIGEYSYYVNVWLGTPKAKLSLAFDTGSDLTWTQCKPCVECYEQVDPLFKPAASSTYSKLGCKSKACARSLLSTPLCAPSTDSCGYNQSYADGSFSVGYFAREKLTLTRSHALNGFYFGCGLQNEGLFKGVAGILGLGMGRVSIVSQGASLYGKRFSYCMPELFTNSTGHLTLGKHGTKSKKIRYTPLKPNNQLPNAYFVELQSISVAGKRLNIPTTVLSNPGAVVDSGTTLTYLPPKAYSALLRAFTRYMDSKKYPNIPSPYKTIDACYDLTGIHKPLLPSITLFFKGRAHMDMSPRGIALWVPNTKGKLKYCLAFASSGSSSGFTVLGNFQQQTFDIVYDIDGGKIGFGSNGC